jgi:hypothetical protein
MAEARDVSAKTFIELVMASQTVTRATECDFEPGIIYDALAEAGNLPKWAPVFADAVQRIGDGRYRVSKSGQAFDIEVPLNPAAGTVDYIREMANGKRGGAYLRVMPRPLGGCTIVMTVPIGPTTNESEVAKVLEQELADLVRLARS